MKRITRLAILLLIVCNSAVAQEKFTGLIEYKVTGFSKEKDEEQPEKIKVWYGKDKVLMAMFGAKTGNDQILINTVNDTMYMIDPREGSYMAYPLSDNDSETPFNIEKTDSFKTFFGYRCRAYISMQQERESKVYIWKAEDLHSITGKADYRHPAWQMLGGNQVMMSVDIYENKERMGLILPENITKMEQVPDSIFDISKYHEQQLGGMGYRELTDSTVNYSMYDTAVAVKSVYEQSAKTEKKKPKTKKKAAPKTRKTKTSAMNMRKEDTQPLFPV